MQSVDENDLRPSMEQHVGVLIILFLMKVVRGEGVSQKAQDSKCTRFDGVKY